MACEATLFGKGGSYSLDAWLRPQPGGYFIEVNVPWRRLGGFAPRRGRTLGFNAVLVDFDEGQTEPTEIMLSAKPPYQLRDPRGFATMVLLDDR